MRAVGGESVGAVYYQPRGESAENLKLMRWIDEEYTRRRFYGSRRMMRWLHEQGYGALHGHLRRFVDYYHRSRTHLGLEKDTPESRPVQGREAGRIVSIPEVGGLHHQYERRAA